MKKLLALVLALVMTLGLATVSSNAAYSDAADVELEEAVDVMSAVGVFQGSDGKFAPKDNLTREQAAKLIAYLDLGAKTAEALPAVQVFDDVEATRWSAKYIAYCQDAGYVSGVGDNKFDPAGALTGYAFGKMVLCVLGYDATIEGFDGSSWALNVAKLVTKAGISDGVDSAASATLTREQAAQYCMNALKADTVEYATKGTNVTINGAVIATGASEAKAVTATLAAKYQTIDAALSAGASIIQLGEKLYGTDIAYNDNDVDDFNQPAKTWTWKNKEVGTYEKEADATLKNGTTYGDIYAALGSTAVKNLGTLDLYIDGTLVAQKSGTAGAPGAINAALITKGSKTDFGYDAGVVTWVADDTVANGNSSVTNIYVDEVAGTYNVIINVINTYAAKVSSITAKTASADRKINFTKLYGADHTAPVAYETESFAKDDIVLYTAATVSGNWTVQTIKAVVPSATAEVATLKSDLSNMVAGGTTYKFNAKSDVKNNVNLGDSYDLYLDDAGYVIYADLKNEATSYENYLVITADKYSAPDALETDPKITANAVTLDGVKLSAVKLGKLDGTKIDDDHTNTHLGTKFVALNTVYSFTKDSAGKYNLKTVAAPFGQGTLTITANQAGAGFKFHAGTTTVGTGITANSSTKFVVLDSGADTLKVYEGIANMVNVANGATVTGAYLAKAGSTVAKVVFVNTDASVSNSASAKDIVYLTSIKSNNRKDDDHTYQTYNVIKGGEAITVTIRDDANNTAGIDGNIGLKYISQYKDEYVDIIVNVANGTPSGYKYYSAIANTLGKAEFGDSVFTVAGNSFVCSDKTEVYMIDTDGNMTVGALEDLTSTNADMTYYVVTKTTDAIETAQTIYMQET